MGLRRAGAQTLVCPGQVLAEKTSLLQGAFSGASCECDPVPLPLLGLIRPGHNFLRRPLPAPAPAPSAWEFLWGWGQDGSLFQQGPSTGRGPEKSLSGWCPEEVLRAGLSGGWGVAGWLLGLSPRVLGSRGRRGCGDISPLVLRRLGGKLKGGSQTERMLEPQATGHFLPCSNEGRQPPPSVPPRPGFLCDP